MNIDPEKLEIFRKMWLEGANYREIEKATGIRKKVINLVVRVLGLPMRKPGLARISIETLNMIREMWMSGLSIAEIAAKLGISRDTVRQYLRIIGLTQRRRHVCKEIPREELERMSCYEVMSDKEIAEKLGTNPYCVQLLRKRYGIWTTPCREAAVIDKVVRALKDNMFVTTDQLRKMGVYISMNVIVEKLREKLGDEIGWFTLRKRATYSYTIFPYYTGSKGVLYIKGGEKAVAEYLVSIMVKKPAPPVWAAERLLRMNGVPQEVISYVREIMSSNIQFYSR